MTYPTDVRWSDTTTANWPHGSYGFYERDIQYGDVVEVDLGGGTLISVTAYYLETRPDASSDQITGYAPAGASVRGYVWDDFEGIYAEDTTIADVNGNYTLTLPINLQTAHYPYVAFADANGDEVGYAAPPPHIRAYPLWSGIYAVADRPHQPVTYTLNTGMGSFTQYGWCGRTNTCDLAYFDSVAPGYIITAELPSQTMVMTVADVPMEPDTANDGVSGDANIPGRLDVTVVQWNGDAYVANGYAVTSTIASSPFAVTFPRFDVRDGMQLWAYHYAAANGHRTLAWRGTMETAYFEVDLPHGVGGVPPHADEGVTAWLYDSDGTTLLASTGDDRDGDPWRFWLDDFQGHYLQPGYWITVTSDSGWTAGMQIPELTVEADADTDLIWGTGPKSMVFVEHGWWDGWDGRFVPVDDYALDRAFFGGDVQYGDNINAIYQAPSGNHVRSSFYWPRVRMDVNYAHDWVAVETVPFAPITVTVAGKGTVIGQADAGGWFDSNAWPWDPQRPYLEPGDAITATGIGLVAAVNPVGAIDGVLDFDADVVSGTIHAPWFVTVTVYCEVWTWGGPSIEIPAVVGDGGSYVCDFTSQGWDLQPGPDVAVRYREPDGDSVINIIRPLNLFMSVNYGHDWVEGDYEAGHTLWITVTESDGSTIKATAELTTGIIPWWGDRTGFSTNLGEPWMPSRPDIEPGDWAYGRMDNGYASSVRMGAINGELDADADTVSGTVYAPWFTQTLNANCGVWVENGPGQGFTVEPDGGSYFCDFSALGWDLLPGQDVGVQYQEPDGDWVINVFREPAADARVEKWVEGGGEVAPGGPVVFTIRYQNEGDAEATTLLLTDTLPANTTYVTDTSGVPASVGPGQVAWTLGPLAPGSQEQFQIVLNNTASPSDTLTNQVDAYTLYDFDLGDNHAEAQVHVGTGQPDLYVNKNPIPGDPAPGQTFLYEINYGNNGPVASGPVVLTDTLPQDTSIVSWYSENGYDLWSDVSAGDQLVLTAPTIPSYWGDRILLRLLLDPGVSAGTQLTNTVAWGTALGWLHRQALRLGNPRAGR
jgi:uncharacterized repeat protein (TIGR01451 family)